jgi:ribosomal protein S18 acetylase RimI-like enzyme
MKSTPTFEFHRITSNDATSNLWKFLAIAAQETEDLDAIQSNPKLSRYIADWNPYHDFGWMATTSHLLSGSIRKQETITIGAAWIKTSPETDCHRVIIANRELPELAIGVRSEYQNLGIGRQLLQHIWEDLTSNMENSNYRRIPGICLRVRQTNPAKRLYERFGFTSHLLETNRVGGQSYAMVRLIDSSIVTLRTLLTPSDIPTILCLLRRKADFDQTMADSITPWTVTSESLERAILHNQHARVVVAEQGGKIIVGFALYYFRFSSFSGFPILWLEDLFVDKSYRRQGTGRTIMNYLNTVAKSEKCSHISWNVSAKNERGIAFYQSLGARCVRGSLGNGSQLTFQWDVSREKQEMANSNNLTQSYS